MAKWGLDSRFRIGANGAQLRRMVVHMGVRFYRIQGQPSTTTKNN
jgi:hypothetical protein